MRSCHWPAVENSVMVASLYTSTCVAQQYLYSLLAPKFFLVRFLHSRLAYVVASLIVVVLLDICLRHLCHVAQHVCGIGVFILSDPALLHIKAGEAEYLLLEDTEVLVRELSHEELLREA